MIVTTDAVVLHSRRYGDTSRIVVLYTEQLGKVSVVARGARTPKSPFGSALEPLSISRVTIYHRKLRGLHTVSAAESLHPGLWREPSYVKLRSAMTVCETLMRSQADEAPSTELFSVVREAVVGIALGHEEHALATGLHARLAVARLVGFGLPVADVPLGSVVKISVEDGLPRSEAAQGYRLTRKVYEALLLCLETDPNTNLDLSDADEQEIDAFLTTYFSHHLDRRMVSRVSDTLR